jgi:phage baseplate assembly protein gpV
MNSDDRKYPGIYVGKVLATDEAESVKMGKIKAEVYPMLVGSDSAKAARQQGVQIEGIATADLPWATPATPLLAGAGSGFGVFSVPPVGSMVYVFFLNGDIYQPVYFAAAVDAVHGLPASRLTHYPDMTVIRFSSGTEITVDDSTGDLTIVATGNVTVTSAKSISIQGQSVTIRGDTVAINP